MEGVLPAKPSGHLVLDSRAHGGGVVKPSVGSTSYATVHRNELQVWLEWLGHSRMLAPHSRTLQVFNPYTGHLCPLRPSDPRSEILTSVKPGSVTSLEGNKSGADYGKCAKSVRKRFEK